MAFAEIVGSLLVLWRWRKGISQTAIKSEQLQEVRVAWAGLGQIDASAVSNCCEVYLGWHAVGPGACVLNVVKAGESATEKNFSPHSPFLLPPAATPFSYCFVRC